MRPLCISIKLLLLLLLTLLLPRDGAASTSSTLLRHGKITSGRIPSAIGKHLKQRHELFQRGRQSLTRRRALVPTGKTSAFASTPTSSKPSYSISPAFVGNSAAVRSGFRQFSQRASRLQGRSQKPFSLRAIFGDVVTNNSEGDHPVWPVAKRVQPVVSALTNIAATAASEALGGFLGGYLLGATSLSTKRLYRGIRRAAAAASHNQPRTLATPTSLLPYSSLTKFSQQSLQFHAHNMAWATEWAKISALFGACRMVVKTLRHDDQDDDGWNAVVGSAMAGALLAAPTKSPPLVLTKHALLYGGSMFLLHPNLWKQGMEAVWLTLPPPVDNQPWYDAIGI